MEARADRSFSRASTQAALHRSGSSATAGWATGSGPVEVNGGTLAGSGFIAGSVTVGRDSGHAAALIPGDEGNEPGLLTIGGGLIFNSGATYRVRLDIERAVADTVAAQ